VRNDDFGPKSAWEILVCGPVFFRGAVFSCCLSIPKRNFDWGTPLGIKRVCLAKVRNDDFGPKSAWEILVCGPGFLRGAVFSCCLSIPKRNFDWGTPLGIKRVCLAKVRNDDFGPKSAWEILVCGLGFFRGAVFSCCLSIPKRNFDWGTPLGIKRVCLAKVSNDDFGRKSAWEILVCGPGFFRGAVFSCCFSIPKRNFDWGTPLGIKRVCLAKVRNDDFGPKSA